MFITVIYLGCLNTESNQNGNIKYYKDYNIFLRSGINEMEISARKAPFIAEINHSDSTILLEINDGKKKNQVLIPKGNEIIYNFYDIHDGPRHYFSKVFKNHIIRYAYTEFHPNQFEQGIKKPPLLYEITPYLIEIITQDTQIIFYGDCYFKNYYSDLNKIIPVDSIPNYAIKPFSIDIEVLKNKNCEKVIQYFKRDTFYSYYSNEKTLFPNYDGGMYGYKRVFEFWKPFHDINQMR